MKIQPGYFLFLLLLPLVAGLWLAAAGDSAPPVSDIKTPDNQPEELGKVHWLRNMDEAQAQARKEGKPILILFQEVPGCATCRNYGTNTLSHPLVVEAIETLFVPLAIFNNKKGADAAVLQYFNEPAWNNPVVRIVSADKQDLTARVNGNYSRFGLVNAMLLSLDVSNRVAPAWLQLLGEELQAKTAGTEQATLGMYCFWTGEKELGQLPGVVSTEAGFMGGKEVVQVEYNPAVISYEDLLKKAGQASCASHVFTENSEQATVAGKVAGNSSVSPKGNYRPDKEPKYYLSRTYWRYVPMTELQAARANSLVGRSQSPASVLSPRQLALADFVQKNQKAGWDHAIGVDMTEAWGKVEKRWKP